MMEVAGGFRALSVEVGNRSIATRFLPWTFVAGAVATLLSWLLAVGWIALHHLLDGAQGLGQGGRLKRRLPSFNASLLRKALE